MNKQLVKDYKETFGSAFGKRVLENLKKCGHFNSGYVPKGTNGHTDIYELCREEGKRAMIIHIERHLNADLWQGETND
jgi:hypothetical protein